MKHFGQAGAHPGALTRRHENYTKLLHKFAVAGKI
jgi:hypothetical protein